MKRLFLIFILSWVANISLSQADSTVLTFEEFMLQVKTHHPVARQAAISRELGDAYLKKSRGAFDPKISGNANQKYFQDNQYYSLLNAGLKIPTWFGLSFQGGYDLNTGDYLNPERTLPDEGLWYAGVNVALGKGLIIDKRRAEYRKAKIFRESSEQQQILMLNELFLQASISYWDWFKSYNKLLIYEEAVTNAFERFEAVKQSALLGDKPFMDTLEATIQVQNRLMNYMESELEYQNASNLLEIFLWDSGFIPAELDSTTKPMSKETIIYSSIRPDVALRIDSIQTFHPELLNTQFKIEQQKIDLKLSRENLKPTLNFKYNALLQSPSGNSEVFSINNYRWGANASIPIFLRKERGELKVNKLKLENYEQDLVFKTEQVEYKINAALNNWSMSYGQIVLWEDATANYLQLLENESTLFNIGESSLFMVNSREKAYINARTLLIEKMAENQKAEIKTEYTLGLLYQMF